MPDYTQMECVDIILVLGECQGNYCRAANLYCQSFPQRRHPNGCQIKRILLRQRQLPSNRRRRRANMPERDHPQVLAVLGYVNMNPHASLRQIERELGIPKSTAQRILSLHSFHPYHITLTQQLTLNYFQRRMIFCSDVATFHSTGQLNRHIIVTTGPFKIRIGFDKLIEHRWSFNVWCGIVDGMLIGPHFFDGHVNGAIYLLFLQNELSGLLENIALQTRAHMWFQQDVAPPHWSRLVLEYLDQIFPNKWIGRGGPIEWCPRSPDLTSPDFFLWGYLKHVVNAQPPTTRDNMIERIRLACQNIPREVLFLLSTIRNFQQRINLCFENNGQRFEHLLQ